MKLVLLNYWRSSASHRVRIALGLKQLAYEYVAVNIFGGAQFEAAYRAKNPLAQVPTLEITEDDGTQYAITQSLPIIEFLEERFPAQPLLPRTALLRARVRQLAEIVNAATQPFQNLSTTKKLKELGGDDRAWVQHFVANGLAAYARVAEETAGAFSVGDAPTVADCCLVPQLASARRFHVDYSQHPLLARIEQACLALPAFANAAPDLQPDAVKS